MEKQQQTQTYSAGLFWIFAYHERADEWICWTPFSLNIASLLHQLKYGFIWMPMAEIMNISLPYFVL
jgi:hypothetical protein